MTQTRLVRFSKSSSQVLHAENGLKVGRSHDARPHQVWHASMGCVRENDEIKDTSEYARKTRRRKDHDW